jgi:hypothetical protein
MVGVGFSVWMDSWRFLRLVFSWRLIFIAHAVPFQRIPASAPTGEVSWLVFLTSFSVSSIVFLVAIPHFSPSLRRHALVRFRKFTSEKF